MNTAYRIEIIGDSVDGTHHGSQTYTVTLVDPQDTSNAGTIVQSRRESKTTFRLKNVDNAKVQQPEVEEHIVYPSFPENFLQGENGDEDDDLESPPSRRKTSQHLRNKTPNTVKVLMEKHRENERLRHHSLNEHLRKICKGVPGSAKDGKETKVVMMQRIIAYIAYLENTLSYMSSELDEALDPSEHLMLTSSTYDIEQAGTWNKEYASYMSEDSKDSESSRLSFGRRLKLSSPTIDSTTSDSMRSPEMSEKDLPQGSCSTDFFDHSIEDSQDSAVQSSNFSVEVNDGMDYMQASEEVVISETGCFDALLSDSHYDNSAMFELPTSTLDMMSSPEEVKWLGSPDFSPTYTQGRPVFLSGPKQPETGIQCDVPGMPEVPVDEGSEMLMMPSCMVSPDQIMPQVSGAVGAEQVVPEQVHQVLMSTASMIPKQNTIIFSSNSQQPTSYAIPCSSFNDMSCPVRKKRKQQSPRRAPLFNITNWSEVGDVPNINPSEWVLYNANEEGGTPYLVGKVEEVVSSNSVSSSKVSNEHPKIRKTAGPKGGKIASTKLDLRKSSWMNGFMMYSRLHRKHYIKRNPGIHTSNISRMMGEAWRGMTTAQQEPYKEQARICSTELQRLLDEQREEEKAAG